MVESKAPIRWCDAERRGSATEEFLDSVGREKYKMERGPNKEDSRQEMREVKIFPLTLLRLGALLSGRVVDRLSHVVLHDVLPGGESPQRVSGALSPTGRTDGPPVLGY